MADRYNQPLGQGYAGIPPGPLSAYLGVQAANQGRDMETLQGAGVVQGLLAKMQAEKRMEEIRSVLGENTPPEMKMQKLSQLGPEGIQVATHLIQAQKGQSDLEMMKQFSGMGQATPEQLDQIGQRLALQGHPGASTVMNIADRRRAAAQNQTALTSMQSAPGQPASPGQPSVAFQGGLGPAQSAVPARPGITDFLTNSPYVGPAAKALQASINSGAITPEQARSHLDRLTQMHVSQTGLAERSNSKAGAGPDFVIPPEHTNLHGDEYLKTLPTGMASVVKSIGSYEAPLNQISSMRGSTKEREAMLARVKQAYPDFNMIKYPIRQKATTEFMTGGPGSPAGNRVAIGQAINHMGTLDKLGQALENKDYPAANAIGNFWATQMGKTPPNNYRVAQTAVGEELMRVFRQVQGSERETEQWIKSFPVNGSPQQIRGALTVGAKLLNGRMDELNNRWNNAMETTGGFHNLISPQAQAALNRFLEEPGAVSKVQGGWTPDQERRLQELRKQLNK